MSKVQQAKNIQARIRRVLNEDWDPLTVYPAGIQDEYDSLISRVYRLLIENAPVDQLATILREFEDHTGGLISNDQKLERVAQKLASLDVKLKQSIPKRSV